jgi:hypothetical protein
VIEKRVHPLELMEESRSSDSIQQNEWMLMMRSVTQCRCDPHPHGRDERRHDGAGTAGAVANAVNDALRVLGVAEITEVPITPEGVLRAVGRG